MMSKTTSDYIKYLLVYLDNIVQKSMKLQLLEKGKKRQEIHKLFVFAKNKIRTKKYKNPSWVS